MAASRGAGDASPAGAAIGARTGAVIDLLLENAVLPLGDPEHDAVAIDAGRVAAVGRGADLRRDLAPRRRLDLAGKALLPGFNDAHVHVWKVGHLATSLVDLRGAASLAAVRDALAARAATTAGWVVARGVNELRLREGRLPTRVDLDAWLPGRAVWVTRVCNHIGVASGVALETAGVHSSTPAPPGGEVRRDSSGRPTGVLAETAMRLVTDRLPEPTDAELREMISAAGARLLAAGVTAATDPGVDERLLGVYRAMDAAGELRGRFNVMRLAPEEGGGGPASGWPPPSVSARLRIDTAKLFLDGGLSGATAALSTSYRHADTTGVLRYTGEEYLDAVCRLDAAGYRVATHVIGDRAIETALAALRSRPEVARRARFEHFGLPTPAHVALAADLGIDVATQPIFLPELGANFREYLPEDFPVTPYPLRSMLDAGICVALSTDGPVVRDLRPLAGVAAAALRRADGGEAIGPHEAITVREALVAATSAGAQLSGDADEFGAIRPGLRADLVVLDRSPLATPPEEVADIGVAMTLIDGVIEFER